MQHFSDTGNLGGRVRSSGRPIPGNEHSNIASDFGRGSHRVQSGRSDIRIIVFGNDENAH